MGKDNSARSYALRLLSIRERSEQELSERLKLKGFSEPSIYDTIEYLKNIRLVDDRTLAQTIVHLCEDTKILGIIGCKQYLKKRGIPEAIIKELTFPFNKEKAKASRFISKKHSALRHYPPRIQRRKLYGMLRRRGFDGETISETLKDFEDADS